MNKKYNLFLLFWCTFHFFAFILSYTQIKIFNNGGKPDADKFWPFVSFIKKRTDHIYIGDGFFLDSQKTNFSGIFVDYDWSELLIYIGFGIFFMMFLKIRNNKETV